ncbi:MAG: AraC family transcriptional regulator [Thermoanaerobaculia bacterium]
MPFAHRVPSPPLDAFVELLWGYDGYVVPHAQERLLPTGTIELVIPLGDPHPVLAGPHSRSFVIDTAEQFSIIGVHFRPGGAFAFLPMPVGELHNLEVRLEDVWGKCATKRLRDDLLAATTFDARFAILESALLRHAQTFERNRAVAYAIEALTRDASVTRAMEPIGFSQRHFIDLFRDETGYTPKVFARVQRFQRLLGGVHTATNVDWSDAALACGYFDQSHCIRDFRAFSGLTPSEYFARRSEHLNHVPL